MTAASSEAGSPDKEAAEPTRERGRDYSANIGLIVIVVLVMGGAILIASQVGLGAGTIIAGFTAIFFTLGVGGGSLRADLRKVAWFGPLTALSASVPRVLAEHNHGAALAVVSVIIFSGRDCCPPWARTTSRQGWGLAWLRCWDSPSSQIPGRWLRRCPRPSWGWPSWSCCASC